MMGPPSSCKNSQNSSLFSRFSCSFPPPLNLSPPKICEICQSGDSIAHVLSDNFWNLRIMYMQKLERMRYCYVFYLLKHLFGLIRAAYIYHFCYTFMQSFNNILNEKRNCEKFVETCKFHFLKSITQRCM